MAVDAGATPESVPVPDDSPCATDTLVPYVPVPGQGGCSSGGNNLVVNAMQVISLYNSVPNPPDALAHTEARLHAAIMRIQNDEMRMGRMEAESEQARIEAMRICREALHGGCWKTQLRNTVCPSPVYVCITP